MYIFYKYVRKNKISYFIRANAWYELKFQGKQFPTLTCRWLENNQIQTIVTLNGSGSERMC